MLLMHTVIKNDRSETSIFDTVTVKIVSALIANPITPFEHMVLFPIFFYLLTQNLFEYRLIQHVVINYDKNSIQDK